MSTVSLTLASLIGVYFFLFIYWRRLNEDYLPAQIFTSGVYMLIGIGIGFVASKLASSQLTVSSVFDPSGLWFWGAAIGFSVAFFVVTAKFHMRTFETLEASVVGLLVWLMLVFCALAVISMSIEALAGAVVLLLLILLFSLLERRYKKFSWYKSGKVGFTSLFVLGIMFLLRAAIALFIPSMVSLVGKAEVVLSLAASFLLFFSVYNLSESD